MSNNASTLSIFSELETPENKRKKLLAHIALKNEKVAEKVKKEAFPFDEAKYVAAIQAKHDLYSKHPLCQVIDNKEFGLLYLLPTHTEEDIIVVDGKRVSKWTGEAVAARDNPYFEHAYYVPNIQHHLPYTFPLIPDGSTEYSAQFRLNAFYLYAQFLFETYLADKLVELYILNWQTPYYKDVDRMTVLFCELNGQDIDFEGLQGKLSVSKYAPKGAKMYRLHFSLRVSLADAAEVFAGERLYEGVQNLTLSKVLTRAELKTYLADMSNT